MVNAAQRSSILQTANRMSGGDLNQVTPDKRADLIKDVSQELKSAGISTAEVRDTLFDAWTTTLESKGQRATGLTGSDIAGFSAGADHIPTQSSKGFSPLGVRLGWKEGEPIKSRLETEGRRDLIGQVGRKTSGFSEPTMLETTIQLKPDQAKAGLDALRGGLPGLQVGEEKQTRTTDTYFDLGGKGASGAVMRLRKNDDKKNLITIKPGGGRAVSDLRQRVEHGIGLEKPYKLEPELNHLQLKPDGTGGSMSAADREALAEKTKALFGTLPPAGLPEAKQEKWDREVSAFEVEGFGTRAQVEVTKDQIGDGDPRYRLEITAMAEGEGDAYVKLSGTIAKSFDLSE